MFKSALALVSEAKQSVNESDPHEIQARLLEPECLIIDVREPDEYRQGHLAASINIPRGILEFRISSEPSLQRLERPIVLYCKTSGRAALSAVALQGMGFRNVSSLAGGFDAWAAAGLPIAKPRNITFE